MRGEDNKQIIPRSTSTGRLTTDPGSLRSLLMNKVHSYMESFLGNRLLLS
jgi:hypothetical protein